MLPGLLEAAEALERHAEQRLAEGHQRVLRDRALELLHGRGRLAVGGEPVAEARAGRRGGRRAQPLPVDLLGVVDAPLPVEQLEERARVLSVGLRREALTQLGLAPGLEDLERGEVLPLHRVGVGGAAQAPVLALEVDGERRARRRGLELPLQPFELEARDALRRRLSAALGEEPREPQHGSGEHHLRDDDVARHPAAVGLPVGELVGVRRGRPRGGPHHEAAREEVGQGALVGPAQGDEVPDEGDADGGHGGERHHARQHRRRERAAHAQGGGHQAHGEGEEVRGREEAPAQQLAEEHVGEVHRVAVAAGELQPEERHAQGAVEEGQRQHRVADHHRQHAPHRQHHAAQEQRHEEGGRAQHDDEGRVHRAGQHALVQGGCAERGRHAPTASTTNGGPRRGAAPSDLSWWPLDDPGQD